MTLEKRLPPPPTSCMIYTPATLADAIVEAVYGSNSERWLEPSCGNGAFLEALSRKGLSRKYITAVDLDERRGSADGLAMVKRGVDFLEWAERRDMQFDTIVGNPPYVRISELQGPLRVRASATLQPSGCRIGMRGNYWYAFLCASLPLLRIGGSLAFVLPAAWDYADYAKEFRSNIYLWFKSVRVFRCLKPLFPDVQEGVVVLVCQGWGKGPGNLRRSEHSSLTDLASALQANSDKKGLHCEVENQADYSRVTVAVGEKMDIWIGAVTGDVEYFLFTDERRRELGIPTEACHPVLSRTRHLPAAVINRGVWESLRATGERIWIFRPAGELVDHPAVRRYLELARDVGGCDRGAFKVRKRDPWFQVRLPPTPHAFLSGISTDGPWLALCSMRCLTATNALYIVRFRDRLSLEERAAWGISMVTSVAAINWKRLVRTYPGGLKKIEPGDLRKIKIPLPRSASGSVRAYKKMVSLIKEGNIDGARSAADRWCGIKR